ncbi:MAG: N-acetylmuramoyl-L-alanine amidase [Novosphingobium sp.]|uniref:N-acetylmuramoyl-L-alanine amidase family protein n=1 Tax=Novosphingobium sp. TaxID=1874826 RepID=UPI0032BCA368
MRRFLILLVILLTPIAVFAAMVQADRTFGRPGRGYDYVVTVDLPRPGAAAALPKVLGPPDSSRPLVVIDPGHGGKDPGAGAGELKEKALTLSLAIALRDELLRQGGVRVALTRSDDTYLFLGERPEIARLLGADLYISIHADSTEGEGKALGATVYTLSAKGSNEAAEKIAARENAADVVNGVKIAGQSSDVSTALVDLAQRQSQTQSELFARLILREGLGRMPFKEADPQSAAFAVLKSPDVPSVLFESGYINNETDVARLTSGAGRQNFAEAVARAIRVFFARAAQG